MRISIFGLGYVGTVSAACFGKQGHTVIGVDTNETKVRLINQGLSPIVEPHVGELLKSARASGKLAATTDHHSAVLESDVSLICVGTPSNNNGSLNLSYILGVATQIGTALKSKQSYHVIALRSTVLPGTVDQVVSLIEKESGKKGREGFGVASNPEFLREGSAVNDFENPPYTVVGSDDPKTVAVLRELYSQVKSPFHSVKTKEAEILKYACNSFHATKVAFANEIGSIAKKFGIDSHVVMNLFAADTKLNISPAYLKPGFSFGGSCLPKDVRALVHAARSADIPIPLVESLIASNKVHTQRVVEWVMRQHRKNIGVLGLSFKPGTDDLRESPVVEVIETLLGKGFSIAIYDGNVNLARLVGANKRYIEHEIPHISSLMKNSVKEVLDSSDVVVIANHSPEFASAPASLRPGQIMLDLVRITDSWDNLNGTYEGICW
jgi:GDP-mannose 6-dehydrogenase